jgi:hypothetical protein
VTNTGNSTATITSISISGAAAASFAQSNTCGAPLLASGGTCSVTIKFTPTAVGLRPRP